MDSLFGPVKIQNMVLKNRFVRSATYDACADENGFVTPQQVELFAELADGEIGLIVTGMTYVHDSGRISVFQNSIAGDDTITGLKRLTAEVHRRGAKIAVQLGHAGRESAAFLQKRNQTAFAPSFVEKDLYFSGEYRSMSEAEIRVIIQAYGEAAGRARAAGFDAVQIHGAHAHLLSQFLSPYTNRRADQWGGTLTHRLRFHQEVYRCVRQKVGQDYPVLIKIGVEDGFPGGLTFKEGATAAVFLSKLGFDALEISQGLRGANFGQTEFRTNIDSPAQEGYFRHWCREIKRLVDIPTLMVGGLRSFDSMAQIIENKETDLVALCRPFVREPNLINRWKSGSRTRATCISCNLCLQSVRKGQPLHCGKTAESMK